MAQTPPLAVTPTGRDVLAAILWAAVPVGFVLGIDAVGIPYEPLEGAPEKDPSYAIVMYALIAAGGVLGSLFGLGTYLIPGRMLASEDFRVLVRALMRRATPGEIDERGRGRLVRAGIVVVAALVVVVATLVTSGRAFVPVLAALGVAVLFGLSLFGSTAQRAARRGHDPRQWMALPGEPLGEEALTLVRPGAGVDFSRFVWRHALVWFLVIVAGGAVLDQVTKVWAQQSLTVLDVRNDNVLVDGRLRRMPVRKYFNHPPAEVHIVNNALSFKYAENPAAAFSLTGNLPEWIRRPFLVGTSTLAMLFIGLWFFLNRRPDGLLMTAFALIMAGALGNLIDRIRFGYVVDFINAYAGFIDPRYIWPTFNVADMCIVGGALSVVLRTLRPLYPEPAAEEEEPGATEGRASSEAAEGGA